MNAGHLKERLTLKMRDKSFNEGEQKVAWKEIGKVWGRMIPLKAESSLTLMPQDQPNGWIKKRYVMMIRPTQKRFHGIQWRKEHFSLLSAPMINEERTFMTCIVVGF
jgi:head-tail adaptor